MLSRRTFVKASAASCVAGPAFISAADAANWPNREIRILCGVPPGSGMDIVVRIYAKLLGDLSKATVIVDNKPGAQGNIATQTLARAKPDGYTIYISPGSSVFAAAPSLFTKLPFDPINDFEHITTLAKGPFLLIVAPDSPVKTVADLVSLLKAQGDKGSYGTTANLAIVASELFKRQFQLQSVEVKYKGTPPAINDLVANNIAFMYTDPAAGVALLNAGRVRAIATTSADRVEALPNIPSAREAGILNTNLLSWLSVSAPKGTPREIVDQLAQWFNAMAENEELRTYTKSIGTDPFPGSPESVKKLLIEETEAWKEYVKISGIEPM